MSILQEFEALSSETGIVLPSLLQKLLATEKTLYGPEWSSTWRERMLQGAAPLSSLYDFEWLQAVDARRDIQEWLNPASQNGKVFLPFAQSRAGDVYCFMPLNESSMGVALIRHDHETSQISYVSFDDFVVIRFLETFANLNHLVDEFSEKEIGQCIKSDVWFVTELMSAQNQNYLRGLCNHSLMPREFHHGSKLRSQNVLSFISQEQLETERAKFPCPDIAAFSIVPRWKINFSEDEMASLKLSSKPISDWRSYALNPKQKMMAIQSYRQEFGISLNEAKVAIDHYIKNTAKNT